jgi:DNA gyrase/topoisomerase IV subunit A
VITSLQKTKGKGLLRMTEEERTNIQVAKIQSRITRKQRRKIYLEKLRKITNAQEMKLENKLRGLKIKDLSKPISSPEEETKDEIQDLLHKKKRSYFFFFLETRSSTQIFHYALLG